MTRNHVYPLGTVGSNPTLSAIRDIRRDDREAEGARLEIVCALTGTEGSNPSLSAIRFFPGIAGRMAAGSTRQSP